MFEHQKIGIDFLTRNKRAVLGDEPGMGKTRQAILSGLEYPVLVICPSFLKSNWAIEIEKWEPDEQVTISFTNSKARQDRERAIIRQTMYYIVHYEQVKQSLELLKSKKFKTILIDECHRINRGTQITTAIEKLLNHKDYSGKVYFLSGTFLNNKPESIHPVLKMVYPGDTKLTSYWRWAETHFLMEPGRNGNRLYKNVGRLRDMQTFAKSFADKVLIRKADLSTLPPFSKIFTTLDMSGSQADYYNLMETKMIIELTNPHVLIKAQNKLTQLMTLRRIVSCPEIAIQTAATNIKLDYVVDKIKQMEHTNFVIVSNFVATVNHYAQVLSANGINTYVMTGATPMEDRQMLIEEFESLKHQRVFLMTYPVAEGFSLTSANHIFAIDLPWNPRKLEQAYKRLHRPGQDKPVTCECLECAKSIDTHIAHMIHGKEKVNTGIESALEKIMRELIQLDATEHEV